MVVLHKILGSGGGSFVMMIVVIVAVEEGIGIMQVGIEISSSALCPCIYVCMCVYVCSTIVA